MDLPTAIAQAISRFTPKFGTTPVTADYLWKLSGDGLLFVASDGDQNDMVTGQTSFADTTPTFLIDVRPGFVVVPLFVNLPQSGTVGGGDINVLIEFDSVKRYSSGGTNEKTFSTLDGTPSRSTVWSNPTAKSGYGITPWRTTVGADVSPAEGAVQGPYWTPEMPYLIKGPGSFLVYTYSGSTGPTWLWSIGFAEWPV